MKNKVAVFLAEGFEEVEAITVVDILRREDIEVDMVSITESRMVMGAHNINVEADVVFEEVCFDQVDVMVIPGGMPGASNLREKKELCERLSEHAREGKLIAAICAGPMVLGDLGLLEGKRACCYPGFEDRLIKAIVTENQTETDGNFITSRGVGTAIVFAAEILTKLKSREVADNLLEGMIYRQ